MKKSVFAALVALSLNVCAADLCPLAVGKDWKGWIKIDFIKVKAEASVMQLAGNDYLVDASIPDLGIKEAYQITCKDSIVRAKDIKGAVTLKQSGEKLTVDHKQDGATAHFEHRIGHLSNFFSWLTH